MNYTIKNEYIENYNDNVGAKFPKYTSQLINWANQNAQATRPKIVGQMSELFPEFTKEIEEKSVKEWKNWYIKKKPQALEESSKKIYEHVKKLREAINLIDEDMVHQWVEDLVISKTYNGMYVQKVILAYLAEKEKLPFRLATIEEEAKGIDGYVGSTAYSIKPITYKTMKRLSETIEVKMIYYTKTKNALKIEVE